MHHSEFRIGDTFTFEGGIWRCTDVGTRTIAAIRIDEVEVVRWRPSHDEVRRTLNREEAEAEGWFNGPPYAVVEKLFDEHDQEVCHKEDEDAVITPDN